MNWDYIRGLFDGDGSACTCRNGKYNSGRLVFYSNDKNYLEKVRVFIVDALGVFGKIYSTRDINYSLVYHRKDDVTMLGLELMSGYLHKRNAVIKRIRQNDSFIELPIEDVDITLSYICGFFDADGCVSSSARGDIVVAFANKNRALLSDIREFFDIGNKLYVLKHNKIPDYTLSVVKKSKVLFILKALSFGSVKKHDKIVESIFWLNKKYNNTNKWWSDLDVKILEDNVRLNVWDLSKILDRTPQAIFRKRERL